jgi:hypothetical protein
MGALEYSLYFFFIFSIREFLLSVYYGKALKPPTLVFSAHAGMGARGLKESPRAEGRDPRASTAMPEAMLRELQERASKALAELAEHFSEVERYFNDTINTIAREFELTEKEISNLFKFKETTLQLLNQAREQARTRLAELVTALENGTVTVERGGKKTYRVRPSTAEWFVSAWLPPRDSSWRFMLPIHGVKGEAVFPDVVKWSPADLTYAQAGWRASDESYNWGKPIMGTTHPWQVLAWSVTRYGRIRASVVALHINKQRSSIEWRLIAKDWVQQWRDPSGKRLAREIAKRAPLGLLTLYLGDGHKHRDTFAVSIGSDDEYYKRRTVVPGIIEKAYETGYGKLLDVIRCDKWLALKNLTPKRDPVYAPLNGHVFWLCYYHPKDILFARTVAESGEEAREYVQLLAALGAQANVYKWQGSYWAIHLKGRDVLRLAELSPEWRRALRELAEKRKIEPRGPVTRKLLELAESPPLPQQNF